jgi:cardiolipin synthase
VNAPNFISLARLFAVPVAVWLILRDRLDLAFWLFVAAGVSDGIDGYLARLLNAQTKLGRYLDPIADKMMLVCTYVALAVAAKLPMWLVILVVSRDVMIVGGFTLAALVGQPIEVRPSLPSKINTVMQFVFAGLVLANQGLALGDVLTDEVLFAGVLCVAATTLASGAGYVVTWVRHVGYGESHERPRDP